VRIHELIPASAENLYDGEPLLTLVRPLNSTAGGESA